MKNIDTNNVCQLLSQFIHFAKTRWIRLNVHKTISYRCRTRRNTSFSVIYYRTEGWTRSVPHSDSSPRAWLLLYLWSGAWYSGRWTSFATGFHCCPLRSEGFLYPRKIPQGTIRRMVSTLSRLQADFQSFDCFNLASKCARPSSAFR